MNKRELIPHLFRTEFQKIIAVLSNYFGIANIQIVEDIVSDSFLLASETWGLKGIPKNPKAWLYKVSKNKAIDFLRKQNRNISIEFKHQNLLFEKQNELEISNKEISDSQLKMLFAVCDDAISEKSQIILALRVLCGFGIEEISNAFLTKKETINKRLLRAKGKLKNANIKLDSNSLIKNENKLTTVLKIIYLLFNEGYFSQSSDLNLKKDFCFEALRLCYLLTESSKTNTPSAKALLSLMCFHISRFDARLDEEGSLILYEDQDFKKWDKDLIERGKYYLGKSSTKDERPTKYHLEAGIAFWHTFIKDTYEKWENILGLYNQLLLLEYSPVIALNRTYALAKVKGNVLAIIEAKKLNLQDLNLYYMLLGDLHETIDKIRAHKYYLKALALTNTLSSKKLINKKIKKLNN